MSDFPELDKILDGAFPPGYSKTTLHCKACGKAFDLNRRWQKFCSDTCRSNHHYKELKQAEHRQVAELEAEIKRLRAENDELNRKQKDLP